jgi:hypothetical protein
MKKSLKKLNIIFRAAPVFIHIFQNRILLNFFTIFQNVDKFLLLGNIPISA